MAVVVHPEAMPMIGSDNGDDDGQSEEAGPMTPPRSLRVTVPRAAAVALVIGAAFALGIAAMVRYGALTKTQVANEAFEQLYSEPPAFDAQCGDDDPLREDSKVQLYRRIHSSDLPHCDSAERPGVPPSRLTKLCAQKRCPRFTMVSTFEECKTAATKLDMRFLGTTGPSFQNEVPPGCYYEWKGVIGVWWNPNLMSSSVGKEHDNDPICLKCQRTLCSSKTYTMFPPNNGCAVKTRHGRGLTNMDGLTEGECDDAARCLGLQRRATTSKWYGQRTRGGCYYEQNGVVGVWWNPHSLVHYSGNKGSMRPALVIHTPPLAEELGDHPICL